MKAIKAALARKGFATIKAKKVGWLVVVDCSSCTEELPDIANALRSAGFHIEVRVQSALVVIRLRDSRTSLS